MPRFAAPAHKLSDAIAPTIIDFGLLAIYTLTAFAGAFVVFLRYDVLETKLTSRVFARRSFGLAQDKLLPKQSHSD